MIQALFLSATLLSPAPDHSSAVSHFASALEREDPTVVADRGLEFGGGFNDIVGAHDQIVVTSARIASVERAEDPVRLLVEIEGTALTAGRRRSVPLPRWWSLELQQADGGWRIASAFILEQRLAEQLALASPEDLERALSREDIDRERFLILLTSKAADHIPDGCGTLSWALDTSRTLGLRKAESSALRMLSYVHLVSGNPTGALLEGQRSLSVADAQEDPGAIADSLLTVGVAHWFANRIDDAVAVLRSAGPLAHEMDDPRMAQRALYMGGVLEIRRGRLREALTITQDLQNLVARYPSGRARMDASSQLGNIHGSIGNNEIAQRQYLAGLEAARELGDPRSEAIFLFNLAHVTSHRDESRDLLRRALRVDALPDGEQATMRLAYARAQWEDGDFDGLELTLAILIDQATAADERAVLAAAYALRAELRTVQGSVDDAIGDARKARALCEAPEGGARASMTAALSGVLTVEGRTLRAAGQHDAAEAVWRANIDITEEEIANFESTSEAGIRDQTFAPYRELIDLLVEQGCARDALIVAERMRARTLRNALRHGRVDLSAGLDAAKRAREEELEGALAAANRALLHSTDPETVALRTRERDEARLALRRFRSELYLANLDLRKRRAETFDDDETWDQMVEPGELVLATVVTPSATFVFALRRGVHGPDILVHTIRVTQAELEERVETFVAALEHRNYAYRDEATALHELLLGPVAAQLESAGSLRIVPDGVLWSLPFHALIDRTGRHVAEGVAVSYSPSLVRHRSDDDEIPPRTLFALADPRIGEATASATRSFYRDAALGALPDAVDEVRSIARLYEDAQVRIGAQANESAFKKDAGAFGVLHLAAHSIVDDRAPMFSSIVLATSGSDPLEDGLLEAREIADLRLNAGIAVLSGCETARGKITPGEGIVGLSWAFLVAGVPRTVVSQWKVGSASTASLMTSFHRHLHDGATPAAALRQAMLDLRRKPQWRHPFYWAPFVVVEYGE